jgi:hypothetical protein
MRRVERWMSRAPSRRSSREISLLTADGVAPMVVPARVNDPSSAAATNAAIALNES